MSGARPIKTVRLSAYGLANKVSQAGYIKFCEHEYYINLRVFFLDILY